MASISIRLGKTDHVSIEQNETGGFTITYPQIESAEVDDAICIHSGPLVQIMELNDALEIIVEM